MHIRSIKEMPPRRDRELAVIFTEMRRAAGVTKEQIAGRLATSVATVEALENGALSDLPDWSEVKRVVTTYAAQLGLDSRPILRRMESQIGGATAAAPAPPSPAATSDPAPKSGTSGPAAPSGPPMPPGAGTPARSPAAEGPVPQPPGARHPPKPAPAQARPGLRPELAPQPETAAQTDTTGEPGAKHTMQASGRLGGTLKGLLNWLLLIAFVGALGAGIWYAAKNPRAVWSALDGLPEPFPRMMRSAWELVRPLDDGGSRPQVSDPEKRKSDKLP